MNFESDCIEEYGSLVARYEKVNLAKTKEIVVGYEASQVSTHETIYLGVQKTIA